MVRILLRIMYIFGLWFQKLPVSMHAMCHPCQLMWELVSGASSEDVPSDTGCSDEPCQRFILHQEWSATGSPQGRIRKPSRIDRHRLRGGLLPICVVWLSARRWRATSGESQILHLGNSGESGELRRQKGDDYWRELKLLVHYDLIQGSKIKLHFICQCLDAVKMHQKLVNLGDMVEDYPNIDSEQVDMCRCLYKLHFQLILLLDCYGKLLRSVRLTRRRLWDIWIIA